MNTMSSTLSIEDVDALRADPSIENRVTTAEKVGFAFTSGRLSESERRIAEEIVRLLIADAEIVVRQRLSESLKHHPDLPHDVAFDLASDVADVAVPMLANSKVLMDDDLHHIIHRCTNAHNVAIAQRPYVSPLVSTELITTNDESVITALLHNKNAQIDEPGHHLIINSFGGVPRIMDTMSMRDALPPTVVERLITCVSDAIQAQLVANYRLTPGYVETMLAHSREYLFLTSTVDEADDRALEALVLQLEDENRLTSTLVVRALCLGELEFVRHAMAVMARITYQSATRLLADRGRSGAEQLYDECGLPEHFKSMFGAVLSLMRKHRYGATPREKPLFRNSVYAWGLKQLSLPGTTMGPEQLITKLLLAAEKTASLTATTSRHVSH